MEVEPEWEKIKDRCLIIPYQEYLDWTANQPYIRDVQSWFKELYGTGTMGGEITRISKVIESKK